MTQWMNTVSELWQQWWYADRIRISPREGRLLRIEPGAVLRIGNYLLEIITRGTGDDPIGPFVAYYSEGESLSCVLVARPLPNGRCQILWKYGDVSRELEEEEIEVLVPTGKPQL